MIRMKKTAVAETLKGMMKRKRKGKLGHWTANPLTGVIFHRQFPFKCKEPRKGKKSHLLRLTLTWLLNKN